MKHHLSKIRREMAVEYAVKHPEVKLSDIALALGFGKSNARVIVSKFFTAAGHSRPLGRASSAFNTVVKRPRLLAAHRAEVKAMLEAGASHPEIAEKFGVCLDTAEKFAREVLGIRRRKKSS